MADEFDLSVFQHRALDHGCFSPLSMMLPHEHGWPAAIVPLQVGVLQFPIPTARRCYRLGQALRRAIESYPEDINVAIVATGGLSHQVHGERAGFNNPGVGRASSWTCSRRIRNASPDMTHAELADAGRPRGRRGDHVARDARRDGPLRIRCLHRTYYLPSMTGIATAIYEDVDAVRDPQAIARHARRGGAAAGRRREARGHVSVRLS